MCGTKEVKVPGPLGFLQRVRIVMPCASDHCARGGKTAECVCEMCLQAHIRFAALRVDDIAFVQGPGISACISVMTVLFVMAVVYAFYRLFTGASG